MNTMCQSCEVAYVASKCIMLWGATTWSRANAHCSEVLWDCTGAAEFLSPTDTTAMWHCVAYSSHAPWDAGKQPHFPDSQAPGNL